MQTCPNVGQPVHRLPNKSHGNSQKKTNLKTLQKLNFQTYFGKKNIA